MGLFDNYDGNMGSMGGMEDMQNPNPGLLSGIQGWLANPRNAAGLQAFGAALAKAGGPQRPSQFAGWGGGLSEALTGLTQGRQGYDDQELKRMMAKLQMQKAQEDVSRLKKMNAEADNNYGLGNGQQAPNLPTQESVVSAAGDYGPGDAPNAQVLSAPQPASSSGLLGGPVQQNLMSLYKEARYKGDAVGAEKILERLVTGFSRDTNKQVLGPDGQWTQPVSAQTGLGIGPGGVSILAPKFAENNAAIKGAETLASKTAEQTVAGNTPQVLPLGPNGGPAFGTPNEFRGKPQAGAFNMPPGITATPEQQGVMKLLDEQKVPFTMENGQIKIMGAPGTATSQPKSSGGIVYGASPAQVDAAKATAVGPINNKTDAVKASNDDFINKEYRPVLDKGDLAKADLGNIQAARGALQGVGKTSWTTPAVVAGAQLLTGLGISSQNAKLYASNAEIFQAQASTKLWEVLNEAKGVQTEGDAARARATYAQLKNTNRANDFILDLAQAAKERAAKRADFYTEALPIANSQGDSTLVRRKWMQIEPSVWDNPIMKKWATK